MGFFFKKRNEGHTAKADYSTANLPAPKPELDIEKNNIALISEIREVFSDIENQFVVYERILFLKNGEGIFDLKKKLNSLEVKVLNLRGKMHEIQGMAQKLEDALLKSRKSDIESRDKHLASHEKEVLDFVYQIDKMIDKLVDQIRALLNIDFKKTALTDKMPKDTETHKTLAKQVLIIRKSIDDLFEKISQLYEFESQSY